MIAWPNSAMADDVAPFSDVRLQKLRVATSFDVALHDPNFTTQAIKDRLRATLSGYVWAEQPREVAVEWPADWREAFKLRWFPRWALRRWPVRMERRTLSAQVVYPAFPIETPAHRSIVRMAVVTL